MSAIEPDGYAVVTATGEFVGIWRSKTVADGMTKPRGGMPAGGKVRPMVFLDDTPVHHIVREGRDFDVQMHDVPAGRP